MENPKTQNHEDKITENKTNQKQEKNEDIIRVFLDVETDGIGFFSPPTQKLLQLAYMITKNEEVVKKRSTFSNEVAKLSPTHPNPSLLEMSKKSTLTCLEIVLELFNHLTNNYSKQKVSIISHNIHFDIGILLNELKKGKQDFQIPNNWFFLCTMRNSTNYCKLAKTGKSAKYSGYKYPKMSELASKLDLEFNETKLHDAQYDVEILEKCYNKGKKENLWM